MLLLFAKGWYRKPSAVRLRAYARLLTHPSSVASHFWLIKSRLIGLCLKLNIFEIKAGIEIPAVGSDQPLDQTYDSPMKH
jgi:hypothetical protein